MRLQPTESALDECKAFTAKVIADLYMGTSNYWPAGGRRIWHRVVGIPCSQEPARVHRPDMSAAEPSIRPAAAVAGHHRDQGDGAGLGPGRIGAGRNDADLRHRRAALCFAYDAKYIEYDKYLISVSNRNGVADNKFLLVSVADGSETVPYTLSFTGRRRRWRCPVSMDCR